jgi:GGDEF domain-containing protein
LISLLKPVDELDRLDELWKTTTECYAMAIRSAGQYAIEVDAESTAVFRAHLAALAEALQKAGSPEPIREIQASFRGELREYRDKTQQRITRLHNEVAAAAAVMESLTANNASDGEDHEAQLQAEMDSLQSVLSSGDADQIRNRAQTALAGIARCAQKIRQKTRLIIAHLQDEIRMLHQEMDLRERLKNCDAITGAWNSTWVDAAIAELVRLDDSFSVLVFRVLNMNRVLAHHSRTVVDGALRALVGRLCHAMGEQVLVGRRSEEQFVAILKDVEPASAIALCAELTNLLNMSYAIQENGKSQNVALQVACGTTERPQGADGESFRQRLEQLSVALAAG